MMKSARRTLGLLTVARLGATWLASAAHAKTIKVVANGTTEAIQSAIDAASPYDTVAVPAGTYARRRSCGGVCSEPDGVGGA
jgi:polygalacturonase